MKQNRFENLTERAYRYSENTKAAQVWRWPGCLASAHIGLLFNLVTPRARVEALTDAWAKRRAERK